MKRLYNLRRSAWAIILAFLFFIGMCFTVVIHYRAKTVEREIGSSTGEAVGKAIGSFKGFTHGMKDGADAGENAGLSAEDTTADVKGAFESVGKLEVLVAGVTLKNIHEVGKAYSGLYVFSGDAVFTIDLNQAEISYSPDKTHIYIWIPEPELELYLNQNSTKKLAETQHFSWTAKAEDGIKEYINSMANIREKAKSAISNYDTLATMAKQAAKEQILRLSEATCDGAVTVEVQFKKIGE